MTETSSRTASSNLSPDFSNRLTNVQAPVQRTSEPVTERKSPVPMFSHRFGFADIAVTVLGAGCIVANEFIPAAWLRWTLAGLCAVLLLSPTVIQMEQTRRQFGLGSIYRLFKKMGLNPVIEGDEIFWECQGKRNAVRIHNGCQVQIYREYPVPMEVLSKFESAASATMDEVFSAKIGIRRESGRPENIFFSTEMLCSSMKEFGRVLAASTGILDAAEERQRVNIQGLLESEGKERNKIGFRL